MSTASFHGNGDRQRTLVVIFLRGGADGLHLVPPHGDDAYHRARPTLGLRRQQVEDLDGFFGLHPALAPLMPAFREGELAIVHATGSDDATRSHFEAQDRMEQGGEAAGGWLGRFLRHKPLLPGALGAGPLSAVALGETLPESLRGAPAATAVRSLDDFSLEGGRKKSKVDAERLARGFAALYGLHEAETPGDPLAHSARDTLAALAKIEELRGRPYHPAGGAQYPNDPFGQGLGEIARLIKARVGLEAVTLDLEGWDSHLGQAGLVPPLIDRLGRGLDAFRRDLGPELERTSVVVMTEFGRRVAENSSLGTDHGRGSALFVLGGGVRGGRVVVEWPGLEGSRLEGPGDLPVVHDFRDVLTPVLLRHMGDGDTRVRPERLAPVFPDHPLDPLAI